MRRFRPLAVGLGLAVVAIAVFIAFRMMQPPPDDLDLARSKTSAGGAFVVAIEPEAGTFEQGTLHSWIATVSTPEGKPVENAGIAIDGGMPQHGHGLPTAPRMTGAVGPGRYRIEGVKFNMGGWWVIRLTVTEGDKSDTVEFNLVF